MKKPGCCRKLFYLLCITLLLLGITPLSFSETEEKSPTVLILRLKKETAETRTLSLLENMSNTLHFYLAALEGFSVSPVLDVPENTPPEKLKAIARDFGIDYGVVLSAEEEEKGAFTLSVTAYQVKEEQILFSVSESFGNFLEALEGAEKIARQSIEKAYSPAPRWGEMLLEPEGGGSFLVYINNSLISQRKKRLTALPAGSWSVRIIQERPFGPLSLLEKSVIISPEKTVSLPFSVPDITEEEKKAFTSLEKSIAEAWFDQDTLRVEQSLALASALLAGTESTQKLISLRQKYQKWVGNYLENTMPEEIAGYLRETGKLPPLVKPEPFIEIPGPSKGLRFAQGALLLSGASLSSAGSVFQVLADNEQLKSEDRYQEYLAAGENFDLLYASYTDSYDKFKTDTYLSYSGWGAGFTLLSAGLYLFPGETLMLSPFGKAGACLGVISGIGGSLLNHIAGIQTIKNRDLWDAYYSASENLNSLYIQYTNGYALQQTARTYGFSLWGGAVLFGGLSLILPGEKRPALSSPGQKVLFSLGSLLAAGSSFTGGLSFDYLLKAQDAYDTYAAASSSFDELYGKYTKAMKNYTLTTYITYGLQAAGGIACITALLLPPKKNSGPDLSEEKPVELALSPVPGGISISLHGKTK